MKKKPKKKLDKLRISKKLLAFSIGAAVLISGQGFINYYFWRKTHSGDTTVIRELIIEAVENLYKKAPIDAKTGDMYIPEARLRIPQLNGQGQLRYSFSAATSADNHDEEIMLSANSYNLAKVKLFETQHAGPQSFTELFDQIPNYQACARQYLIKFTKDSSADGSEYKLSQSITLTDGRTAYLFQNNNCKTTGNENFTVLYFKNLVSY